MHYAKQICLPDIEVELAFDCIQFTTRAQMIADLARLPEAINEWLR
jgi:hypothetical protein